MFIKILFTIAMRMTTKHLFFLIFCLRIIKFKNWFKNFKIFFHIKPLCYFHKALGSFAKKALINIDYD